MEEKKQSLGQATFIYGILLAAAVIVFSLILFLIDVDKQSWINYFSYVIMIGAIFYAQKTFRDKILNGFISYGKAFMVGLLTAAFSSIFIAVWTYVFISYINPGMVEEIIQMAEQKMMEQGMTDLQIDQATKMTSFMYSPLWMTFMAVFGNIFAGAIISLITAIFVKKEDQSTMPVA